MWFITVAHMCVGGLVNGHLHTCTIAVLSKNAYPCLSTTYTPTHHVSSQGGGSPHKSGARGGDQFSDADGHNHKKQRVVWSVEMHQQFVNAVNQLGVDSMCGC